MVMDTRERSDFPFFVRTFVKGMSNIASIVTAKGEEESDSEEAVEIIRHFLDTRAKIRAEALAANCASSFDVKNIDRGASSHTLVWLTNTDASMSAAPFSTTPHA
jgi:hypothetical protein